MNNNTQFYKILYLFVIVAVNTTALAQQNLVPNPGFEELSDCDIEYGQIYKAAPWEIVDFPLETPDLFHTCSTNAPYVPPIEFTCQTVVPNSGNAMVGMAHMLVNERMYVRLTEDLPLNMDIYVAYSILPIKNCENPYSVSCQTNTQCLAFSDFEFKSKNVVLELESILYESETWSKLQTCYRANGTEDLVLLGNYKSAIDVQIDCDSINPEVNFTYFFTDDVIVSPFDVVPDTLYICGDEVLNFDISFYDVPINWSDGWAGGIREINEGGRYTVLGDLENCSMEDQLLVIKIPDETETIVDTICENGVLRLTSPVLAEWPNGVTSTSFKITEPGNYTAKLQSTCGERFREYIVEEGTCEIQYYVPNVFSPNDDGVNDKVEFFFNSEFQFSGDLNIYSRWGSLLYSATNDNYGTPISWDGTYKGRQLDAGVFVWIYRYVSSKDGKARVISGDITLIR